MRTITLTLCIVLFSLAACGRPSLPRLNVEGKAAIEVKAEPIRFLRQGVTGGQNWPPAILSAVFTMQCLTEFGGTSAQDRANQAVKSARIYKERFHTWLINPRIKGRMYRQVREDSVPNLGCDPVDLDITQETTDEGAIKLFLIRHPEAIRALKS
jgi:hypothetical protein